MDMDGMDMGDTGDSSTSMMMMKPYVHFTGGDSLFFQSWGPSSSGAIAGACIGLAFLAIFERWVAAIRGVLESHWRRRYEDHTAVIDTSGLILLQRARSGGYKHVWDS